MTKVDFSQLKFDPKAGQQSYDQWLAQLKAETGKSEEDFFATTMENINIKPLYTAEDIKDAVKEKAEDIKDAVEEKVEDIKDAVEEAAPDTEADEEELF